MSTVQSLNDLCEQMDPSILREMRKNEFRSLKTADISRVQDSWMARSEKKLLVIFAEHTPRGITPDHLTGLGFLAQVGAGVFYAVAAFNRYALLLVVACLALNWLGDSLDGTLARVRQRTRPRYGFYVDHMVDTLGAVFMMGGLALSGYMHPAIAIGLLIAFLMLSIQSYLAANTLGEFRLSFWRFGPTELRILLAIGNVALLWRPLVHFRGDQYRLFDVGGAIGLIGMMAMLIFFTAQNALRLFREERLPQ